MMQITRPSLRTCLISCLWGWAEESERGKIIKWKKAIYPYCWFPQLPLLQWAQDQFSTPEKKIQTTTLNFFCYIQLNSNIEDMLTISIFYISFLRYLLYVLIIYNCTSKAHTSKCTSLIQYWLSLHLQGF